MGLLAYLKTQFVLHLLIGFVFVVSGLVINFTQLCTLALWPISKHLYRRINCRLSYSLWSRKCPRPQGHCAGAWGGGGGGKLVPGLSRGSKDRPTPDTPSQNRARCSSGSLRSHPSRAM